MRAWAAPVSVVGVAAAVVLAWTRLQPPPLPAPHMPPVSLHTLLTELVEPSTLARWPDPPYHPLQHTSTDPRSVAPDRPGWFANDDRGHFVRDVAFDGRTEHVVFEATGPGAVVRMWSANPGDGGTLRVRVDGATTPVLEMPLTDWLAGRGPAPAPLAGEFGRGLTSYAPIPYAQGVQVTVDRNRGKGLFYAVSARKYDPGTTVHSATRDGLAGPALARSAAALAAPWPEPTGEPTSTQGSVTPESPLRLTLPDGPAAIVRLELAVPPAADLDALWLKMVTDGEATVSAPLSGLLGIGPAASHHAGWLRRSTTQGEHAVRAPMPYAEGATLEVTGGTAGSVPVTLRAHIAPWPRDGGILHLHVAHRQATVPTRPRSDWRLSEPRGIGVYIGDTLSVVNPVEPWWGGGDERIALDGEAVPSLLGTGTEDLYGFAWCANDLFSAPFHAQTHNERAAGDDACNHSGGRVVATRVRSLDALPFVRGLTFDLEIWHWEDTAVQYAATSWWYARTGHP